MSVRVNIFGDLCLQGMSRHPIAGILAPIMAGAYNVVNLECPLTTAVCKRPYQAINLKANPESIEIVKQFDAVSLANNHIRDYLDDGCQDTIDLLQRHGVSHFGIGRTVQDCLRPLVVERDGMRLAFLGATRYANCSKGSYGTASDGASSLLRVVGRCHEQGCFTVVYLHAGYEYVDLPAPRERALTRRCVDSGADLVVISHPHVYQGFEMYKGKWIYYSLGNLLFHSSIMNDVAARRGDPRLFNSFYLSVDINDNHEYSCQVRGYRFDDAGFYLYGAAENVELVNQLERISKPLVGSYFQYWRQYYRQAVLTCRQNKKIREDFQKLSERRLIDRLKILLDFNSQDLRNRLANLVPWFFS